MIDVTNKYRKSNKYLTTTQRMAVVRTSLSDGPRRSEGALVGRSMTGV